MADMLINLVRLFEDENSIFINKDYDDYLKVKENDVVLKRVNVFELSKLKKFISENFSSTWADEASACVYNKPVTCIVAIRQANIIGFAAYEGTRRGFFGPTGVLEEFRGQNIGKVLLIEALRGMYEIGYAYGIIGSAGPTGFYEKVLGDNTFVIPNSIPGIYSNLID